MRVLGECISIDGVAWPGTLYDAEIRYTTWTFLYLDGAKEI